MAKVKHVKNAPQLVMAGFAKMEPWAGEICFKLREIVLGTDKAIIEDWKWGPNYYCDGMICGIWGFKKHVTIVFFQGALLKDPKKLLSANPDNLHNRHMKFTQMKEVNAKIISAFVKESIANNKKGNKLLVAKDKTVVVPEYFKKLLIAKKIFNNFEAMPYSKRKDYVSWIEGAKQEETRAKRIKTALEKIGRNEGMNDKYKKGK